MSGFGQFDIWNERDLLAAGTKQQCRANLDTKIGVDELDIGGGQGRRIDRLRERDNQRRGGTLPF